MLYWDEKLCLACSTGMKNCVSRALLRDVHLATAVVQKMLADDESPG